MDHLASFFLKPVTPTDAKNKPTFPVCLLLICLVIKVSFGRSSSALLIQGLLIASFGAHWNWQEVGFHMPHPGPFTFSSSSFEVG